MKIFPTFKAVVDDARTRLVQSGVWVAGDQWQSIDVSNKPEMITLEILNYSFQVQVKSEVLTDLKIDIEPNEPWASNHFQERIGGMPINPGREWANWPWGNSADKFRTENGGQFSHTYMERFWPKYANRIGDGPDGQMLKHQIHWGIRYRYGDAYDVVHHLHKHPLSRQAYLPIWFPEDTGVVHKERVPCTLGYHFIQRQGYLHLVYDIRSCDIVRHFQDDIYLAVRLQLWMLDELRKLDQTWKHVKPGFFTMHVHSLHCFRNDVTKHVKNGKWVA